MARYCFNSFSFGHPGKLAVTPRKMNKFLAKWKFTVLQKPIYKTVYKTTIHKSYNNPLRVPHF